MNIILIYFALKYKGDWDQIYKALSDKERVSIDDLNETEKKIIENQWQIITILDIDYPRQLKDAYKPPFLLWVVGDKSFLENKFICVTGSWNDGVTIERLNDCIPEIEKNNKLITTMFSSLDKEVNQIFKTPKLHVLVDGINKHSLDEQANILITEYPPDEHIRHHHFAARNRIVSAFAESLVLLNSERNSGIQGLINNFLSLGKEVYCFPGDGRENDGNSFLIQQGANLITKIKDASN